jgi:hypothetical protein
VTLRGIATPPAGSRNCRTGEGARRRRGEEFTAAAGGQLRPTLPPGGATAKPAGGGQLRPPHGRASRRNCGGARANGEGARAAGEGDSETARTGHPPLRLRGWAQHRGVHRGRVKGVKCPRTPTHYAGPMNGQTLVRRRTRIHTPFASTRRPAAGEGAPSCSPAWSGRRRRSAEVVKFPTTLPPARQIALLGGTQALRFTPLPPDARSGWQFPPVSRPTRCGVRGLAFGCWVRLATVRRRHEAMERPKKHARRMNGAAEPHSAPRRA